MALVIRTKAPLTVALRKESVDRNDGSTAHSTCMCGVALRKESVDRNRNGGADSGVTAVALRKESVDRNSRREISLIRPYVALRKESVDRNHQPTGISLMGLPSLSARRAWIEIAGCLRPLWPASRVALRKESVDRNLRALERCFHLGVALRKESVDRNIGVGTTRDRRGVSLSARRAWIEIACLLGPQAIYPSRSPQGERG